MATVIIAYNPGGSAVPVNDLGISVPASEELTLTSQFSVDEIDASYDLYTLVGAGTLQIRNTPGGPSLSTANALKHIKVTSEYEQDYTLLSYPLLDGSRAFTAPITVPNGVNSGQAVNVGQLNAAVVGLSWKEAVESKTPVPPGSPTTGDRYMVTATSHLITDVDTANEWFKVAGDVTSELSFSTHAITDVDTTNDWFKVSGDITADLTVGDKFRVSGSTGNDGTWTISVIAYIGGESKTQIDVVEDVTDSTADGDISYGDTFTVTGSTGNDGTYHVSDATYIGGEVKTQITVVEDITNATADGTIKYAQGAWNGYVDYLTYYSGTAWVFPEAPADGDAVFVKDEDSAYVYTGTAWTQFSGTGVYVWGDGLNNVGNTVYVGEGYGTNVGTDTVAVDLTNINSPVDVGNIADTFPPLQLADQGSAPSTQLAAGTIACVNGEIYAYDSSRSKWLAVAYHAFNFVRGAGITTAQYLRVGEVVTTLTGIRLPHNSTLVAISVQAELAFSASFRVRKNSGVGNLLTFSMAGVAGAHDASSSINLDFTAGDYVQLYVDTITGTITRPIATLYFKRRA